MKSGKLEAMLKNKIAPNYEYLITRGDFISHWNKYFDITRGGADDRFKVFLLNLSGVVDRDLGVLGNVLWSDDEFASSVGLEEIEFQEPPRLLDANKVNIIWINNFGSEGVQSQINYISILLPLVNLLHLADVRGTKVRIHLFGPWCVNDLKSIRG